MSKKYFLFDEIIEEYSLIAIHCNLDDFSLAYFLNKNLNANFKRLNEGLIFKNLTFEIFNWKSIKDSIDCSLISNQNFIDSEIMFDSNSLFNLSGTKKVSLISSLPNLNFIIKIIQVSLSLFKNDFFIRKGCLCFWIPVNHSKTSIN